MATLRSEFLTAFNGEFCPDLINVEDADMVQVFASGTAINLFQKYPAQDVADEFGAVLAD